MLDPVRFIFRLIYFLSRLFGVINFEIDLDTGQASVTTPATIYGAVATVAIFSLMPLLTHSKLIRAMWLNAYALHDYIILVIYMTRVCLVLGTLLSRWWQRDGLIRLINTLSRLAMRRPQVERFWRRKVILKFLSTMLSVISQVLVCLLSLNDYLSTSTALAIGVLYLMTFLVNIIVSQLFFIYLNIYGHYCLLNQELSALLAEIRSLEAEPRRSTRMIRGGTLADRLEDIARGQSKLQNLFRQASRLFCVQTLGVTVLIYVSVMATIYLNFFSSTTVNPYGSFTKVVLTCSIIFYYADILITLHNMFSILEAHTEMLDILQDFSMIAPGLDSRLEAVYESFLLQLARNPMKLRLLHLYRLDRAQIIAMASSIITNSLVLIQIQVQNT